MYIPSIVWTTLNRAFIAKAVDIIQPYLSTSLTEVSRAEGMGCVRITERTTNDSGIIHIPGIVTNCSPDAIVKYLHPTLSPPVSSDKSQTWNWNTVYVTMLVALEG